MSNSSVVEAVGARLQESGLHGALEFLNSRTPHRFTGVYRYDGDMLRNEALYDRFSPDALRGDDVPMPLAYCALVGERGEGLVFADGREDPNVSGKVDTAVISYCGALMRDESGRPYGTVCHFDLDRCQPNVSELERLDEVTPLIYRWLQSAGPPGRK